MAVDRIDKQDSRSGVVDQRQRPMIGQPGCLLPFRALGFSQKFGRPDTQRVGPVIGIETDRPAIKAPLTGGDEALTVGMKQKSSQVRSLR